MMGEEFDVVSVGHMVYQPVVMHTNGPRLPVAGVIEKYKNYDLVICVIYGIFQTSKSKGRVEASLFATTAL